MEAPLSHGLKDVIGTDGGGGGGGKSGGEFAVIEPRTEREYRGKI